MDFSLNRLSELYVSEIVRLHGVQVFIISNRDPRFISRFWNKLQEALNTQLHFNTAFHPQNDGQSERVIQILEDMLRRCALEFEAVGIDANNGIYPLAYAAVESENKASWFWFLELLAIDLEIVNSYQIYFMSDKQKGLLKTICMMFPNAETRHCVRHLHVNFKKAGFRTNELKDLLWKAIRASTTRDFEDVMEKLKKTNQHTYDWLKEKNPTHWSRSHFSIRSHSDMLVNNLFESFNKVILEARGKPILTMMETIRTKIMLLIFKKKEETDKWKGMLCPKIKKKLDVNIKDSLRCVPSHVGGDKYQVECGLDSQHVVDLVENSCSCKNWDLTSIPCMHVLADIRLKDEFPETYIQTWPPDRPTKVRRKEPDEPKTTEKLSKRGVDMRCSKCKRIGHNKRSCKGEIGQNISVKKHKVGVPTQQQATPNQQ
ncbi:uncharacterized protein LOC105800338 [Gossypium raimondii]|uniref:uncharacterized protein LOC105800338 n=1 Tax=Gossypium raimondii TaxID=29730 RepID=UPI00227B365B|nr:uncharacterized protein LOC105800338 [Gossypium raimondii]